MDYYEELGVTPAATDQEIHRAYRRLVRLVHPDQQMDPAVKKLAEKQMIRLNQMHQTLLDPVRRRTYDHELRSSRLISQRPIARKTYPPSATPAFAPSAPPAFPSSAPPASPPDPPPELRRRTSKQALWAAGALAATVVLSVFGFFLFSPHRGTAMTALPARASGYSNSLAGHGSASDTLEAQDPADNAHRRMLAAIQDAYHREAEAYQREIEGKHEQAETVHAPGAAPKPAPRAKMFTPKTVFVVQVITSGANSPPAVIPAPDVQSNTGTAAVTDVPATADLPRAPSIDNVSEPKVLSTVPAVYPSIAKSARIEGTVEFMATIDDKGSLKALKLIRGPLPLVAAARDAVSHWTYQPGVLNGTPVEDTTRIAVVFKMSD